MSTPALQISRSGMDYFYPTYSSGSSDSIGEWIADVERGMWTSQPVRLLRPVAKRSSTADRFEAGTPTIGSTGEEEVVEETQAKLNLNRDEALGRLSELESFAKTLPDAQKREALRSCRSAIAFVSFWPSDLDAPDADIDDDGVVSVEQFRSDGTLQAVFDFLEAEKATYALLTGTRIVDKGYLQIRDPSEMAKIFGTLRSVVGEQG